MTNLIIDLSNLAHRSMFVIGGYGSKSFTFDSQSEVDQLMRKMAMDIAFIVRLANPSRIIFAIDSKSWRKQIQIEENEGYKGQRKYAAHINWDNVYGALSEFSSIMENNGLIVSKIDGAEADDIIALWANELQFKQNQHVIIVTGDEDMRQLVKAYEYETGKYAFSTVFNPFSLPKVGRKLFIPEHFFTWLNEEELIDIWNLSTATDVDKVDFKRIRDTEKVSLEQIDGNMIAMRKVFCGDDGDNVPALFSWIAKDKDGNILKDKNGEDRIDRITPAKFDKIYEILQTNSAETVNHNSLLKKEDAVLTAVKQVTKQIPPFKIKDRLERQIKLIVLDENFFPDNIVTEFHKNIKSDIEKPRANYSSLNMQELLNGTRYVREKSKGTVASIFKDIDKIKGTSLF